MNYRPDIDGLRAISILLILFYHVDNAFIPGGFIGVDVFFVISGYLITTIVWKEIEAGRFSFVDFYARRIRRIFPPVLIVLFVSLVVGWNSLFAHEFKLLGKHIAASAGFVSNLVYQSESGYFDQVSVEKPLLHLWSLAIEEQFYLLWPLVLCGIRLVPVRIIPSDKQPAFRIIAAITGGSLLLCLFLSWYLPHVVFYALPTRAWELGAGALLAVMPRYVRSTRLHNRLAWLGLGLISIAASLFDHGTLYPGWAALFPVMGAMALIASGPLAWLNTNVLASRVLVRLGQWSFSIYLWHWPLLYFLRTLGWSQISPALLWAVVPLSICFGAITHALVERPVKNWPLRRTAGGLLIAMSLVGYLGFNVFSRHGLDFRERITIEGFGGVSAESRPECLAQFSTYHPTFCQIHDGTRPADVLLLGDSMGHNAYDGVAQAYAAKGLNLAMIGWPGKPPLLRASGVDITDEAEVNLDRLLSDMGADPKYSTILLTFRLRYVEQVDVNRLAATLRHLRQSGKQVVFLLEPPMLPFAPISCVGMPPLRPQVNKTCSIREADLPAHYFSDRADVLRVLKAHQVQYFDAHQMLCTDQRCSFLLDGQVMYRTVKYLTEKGSAYVYRGILESLQQ